MIKIVIQFVITLEISGNSTISIPFPFYFSKWDLHSINVCFITSIRIFCTNTYIIYKHDKYSVQYVYLGQV